MSSAGSTSSSTSSAPFSNSTTSSAGPTSSSTSSASSTNSTTSSAGPTSSSTSSASSTNSTTSTPGSTSSTTSSSSTSSTASSTPSLCAGKSIPLTAEGTPLVLGASNYEAIIAGNATFEVACYADVQGDDLNRVDAVSLQACAESCASHNANRNSTTAPCVGAAYSGINCFRKKSYGIPRVNLGQTSIRLIDAGFGYPRIDDQMYPVPRSASSTYCVGPSSTAFAFQTVFPQRVRGSDFTYTTNKYEVGCQRAVTGTILSTFLADFTLTGNTLNNWEDCLRYCSYANEFAVNSCRGFNWIAASTNCELYGGVTGAVNATGISGGRFFTGSYLNSTQRT